MLFTVCSGRLWYVNNMDLHRAEKKPDWEKLRARHRNFWQRWAARTNGIVTPGNAISALGFVLVLYGLLLIYRGDVAVGMVMVALGRILDMADGYMAHKTGTKSPLGEAVDATIDKVEIAVALPVLAFSEVLLPWQALALALLQVVNIACAAVARLRRISLHASELGKYAATLQWTAIVLYGFAVALEGRGTVSVLLWIAHIIFALSIVMGTVAASGYIKDAAV